MELRGPKPKGAAHALMLGYYRPSRHRPRPEPTAEVMPSELSEAEQAERKRDIADFRRRLYGEAGPEGIDPGSRSGGNARRIR